MQVKLTAGILALMVAMAGSAAFAQRESDRGSSRGGRGATDHGGTSVGTIDYNDISKRNSQKAVRDEKKEKAAEEAKKKAEEQKRQAEREKRWGQNGQSNNGKTTTMSSSGGTSASKNQAKGPSRPGDKHATKPTNAGGSTDPTTREVTEVMLEAVKTQKVNFDPAEAKNDPDMLLLNAPKFDNKERLRAGDAAYSAPL